MRTSTSLCLAVALVISIGCGDSTNGGGASAGGGGSLPTGSGGDGASHGSGASSAEGGGGSTGSAGGGQGGGGQGGASAGCSGGGYILCEDFEATAVGAIPGGWQFPQNSGSDPSNTGVSDDQAHGGAHALKIVSGYQNGIAHDGGGISAAHWGRVHYRVGLPVPPFFVHTTAVFFHGDGPVNGSEEVRVVGTVQQAEGPHQWLYNVQPNGQEFGTGSSYDWTFDGEWHCAEWELDGENQSYHFYYDGTEVDEIALENGPGQYDGTDIPSEFDVVFLGWSQYQMNDGANPAHYTVWLDDFAIGTERVGCAP